MKCPKLSLAWARAGFFVWALAIVAADNVADNLEGRTFWSTKVKVDGADKELVKGTKIQLSFRGNNLSAGGGCNGISGPCAIDGGILRAPELSMTQMGGPKELHEQDNFVAGFLGSRPAVALAGNDLVLRTDSVTIDFLDRREADPDRPLVGTYWVVGGFIDGDIASAYSIDREGWVRFDEDGILRYFDGFEEGSTTYRVTSEGMGELWFNEVTDRGSSETESEMARRYAANFRRVLAAGKATYEIEWKHLVIRSGDCGITFNARDGNDHGQAISGCADPRSSEGAKNRCIFVKFTSWIAAMLARPWHYIGTKTCTR